MPLESHHIDLQQFVTAACNQTAPLTQNLKIRISNCSQAHANPIPSLVTKLQASKKAYSQVQSGELQHAIPYLLLLTGYGPNLSTAHLFIVIGKAMDIRRV